MKKIKLSLLLCFAVSFSAFGQKSFDVMLSNLYKETVPLIKPVELHELLENDNDVIILDTRDKKEFEVSHIEDALRVGYDDFDKTSIREIPKNAKVIVYCTVGYRSERIGETLQKMGFTDVHNLYGGIFEWKHEGLSTFNKSNIETDSVHTFNKAWSKWLKKGTKVY